MTLCVEGLISRMVGDFPIKLEDQVAVTLSVAPSARPAVILEAPGPFQ